MQEIESVDRKCLQSMSNTFQFSEKIIATDIKYVLDEIANSIEKQ